MIEKGGRFNKEEVDGPDWMEGKTADWWKKKT